MASKVEIDRSPEAFTYRELVTEFVFALGNRAKGEGGMQAPAAAFLGVHQTNISKFMRRVKVGDAVRGQLLTAISKVITWTDLPEEAWRSLGIERLSYEQFPNTEIRKKLGIMGNDPQPDLFNAAADVLDEARQELRDLAADFQRYKEMSEEQLRVVVEDRDRILAESRRAGPELVLDQIEAAIKIYRAMK